MSSEKQKLVTPIEKDRFMTILFSLLAIYIPTLIGILSVMNRVSSTVRVTQIKDPILQAYSFLLFLPLFIILTNLFTILICGALELNTYYRKKVSKNEQKMIKFMRTEVLTGPTSLISNCIIWAVLLLPLLFLMFNNELAWTLFIFYMLSVIIALIMIVKNKGKISNWAVSTFMLKRNNYCTYIISIVWAIVFLLSIIFVIFNAILFYSIHFDFSFDKEKYFNGEDVYVQISPRGLLLPYVKQITYSTPPQEISYVRDPGFGGAPIYLKIYSSNLTIYPYNSYITIIYDIKDWKIFRNSLTKSEFVPVFNYTSPARVSNHGFNESIIKQY